MEYFRSADMSYVALTMTNEASHATVRELGKFGRFHVHDLSVTEKGQPHKSLLYYKKRVQDCLAIEKRLLTMKSAMIEYGISLEEQPLNELHHVHGDVLEACRLELEPMEKELSESINFLKSNKESIARLVERRQVLNAVKGGLISDVMQRSRGGVAAMQGDDFDEDLHSPLDELSEQEKKKAEGESDALNIRNVIVGTIPSDQQVIFARMLYRVSRGNAFARFKEIKRGMEARVEGESSSEARSVFYAVVLGNLITTRVKRMCEAFKVYLYAVPETPEEIRSQIERIRVDLADKRDIEYRTEHSIQVLLQRWGSTDEFGSTPLRDWQHTIANERQICSILMRSHFYLTMISLEGYVPTTDIHELKARCKMAVEGLGHPPAAIEVEPTGTVVPSQPPTYFKSNKFTSTFQGIVDTYGSPRYKEANPGLFLIISFPFMFGVMYGDIGHGILLTLFAGLMIYYEPYLLELEKKRQLGEIPTMAFGGRYVIFLMGLFAVYCGMIYNDCLSIPLNVWGSNYYDPSTANLTSPSLAWTGGVYPIGVDPSWAHKINSLAFANSMKMKMAVTIGITHMTFSLGLSLLNHIHFKDNLAIYFEFIPRIIFLMSTFGYMILMILMKWSIDWTQSATPAPNLIQTMINMFLAPGYVDPQKQLYAGQAGFQVFLVLCALFSVPVMLFAKPYAHKLAHEKKKHAYAFAGTESSSSSSSSPSPTSSGSSGSLDDETESKWNGAASSARSSTTLLSTSSSSSDEIDLGSSALEQDAAHEEFSFSDEMIHNSIHTIEFVLGCVSNTASYLRLWALSLAHAQLADVFWSKMIMQYGILNNGFMAFAGFAVWFGATFAVLLCMDVLECFLHALRLHWVEGMNKHFAGDGEKFDPFVFESKEDLFLN